MEIPITGSHFDALERANCRVRDLVASELTLNSLRSFVADYCGPPIEIQAIFPVMNALQRQFKILIAKYDLQKAQPQAYYAAPEDAEALICYFEFLSFITENLCRRGKLERITVLIDIDPLQFCLAANPEVAIAAMSFSTLSPLYENGRRESDGITLYDELIGIFERRDFVPQSGSYTSRTLDYGVYLDSDYEHGALRDIKVGDFHVPASEIEKNSTLELIRQGMQILSRDQWPDLFHHCRCAVASRRFDLEERLVLTGLHVMTCLAYEHLVYWVWRLSSDRSLRYLHILNPHLLQKFPKLIKYAYSVLVRRSSINRTYLVCTENMIHSNELLNSGLRSNSSLLINGIDAFYSFFFENEQSVLDPAASSIIIDHLIKLNHNHAHIDVQTSILKILKRSIADKCFDFAPTENYIHILQSFFVMVKTQLGFDTPKDKELTKGLLLIIKSLLENDISGALALANDSLSFNVLALAMERKELEAVSIKCLSTFLAADLLCYNSIDEYGLWPKFASVSDHYALTLLYSSLTSSDKGKTIIEKYKLTPKFIQSLVDFNFSFGAFHNDYSSSVTDFIVSEPKVLDEIGALVPQLLQRTWEFLEHHSDESAFRLQGIIYKRLSRTANVVDHLMQLLAVLVHRDAIRKPLQAEDNLELLIKILSHRHLPAEFTGSVADREQVSTIFNELFLSDYAETLLSYLFKGLANELESVLAGDGLLRDVMVFIAVLSNLNLKKSAEFTDSILKFMLFNADFKKLPGLIARLSIELSSRLFDYLTGEYKAITECFWPPNSNDMGTLPIDEEMYHANKITVPFDEYSRVRSDVMVIYLCSAENTRFYRLLVAFINFLFNDQIKIPDGFDGAYIAHGVVNVISNLHARTTRDRFIISELAGMITFSCSSGYNAAMFLVAGGVEALYEFWIKLHVEVESNETVKFSSFTRRDYTKKCEEIICDLIVRCSKYGGTGPAIEQKDTRCSKSNVFKHRMKALEYLIQRTIETHAPIGDFFVECWAFTEYDLGPHIPFRDYVLANLDNFFKNQGLNECRYGSELLSLLLRYCEPFDPILGQLVPDLFQRNEPSSLVLLAGMYTLLLMKPYIPVPSNDQVAVLFCNIKLSGNELCVLSSAQILLAIPEETLRATLSVESNFLAGLISSIELCKSSAVLVPLLELAARCFIFDNSQYTFETTFSVIDHCFDVFESQNFDYDSLIAYSMLTEFLCAISDGDMVILEATMAHLAGLECGKEGISLDSLTLQLDVCRRRSPEAFQNALQRFFITDSDGKYLISRRMVFESLNIPLVNGELPELQTSTKKLIQACVKQFIQRAPIFATCYENLIASHEHSASVYASLSLYDAYAGDFESERKVDNEVVQNWEQFRKSMLGVRLFSDLLSYITPPYGAAAEYISQMSCFNELIECALDVSYKNSSSCFHRERYEWTTDITIVFEFVKNLLVCNPEIIKRTLASFEAALNASDTLELRAKRALGILGIKPLQEYYAPYFLAIKSSSLLETLNDIVHDGELKGTELQSQLTSEHTSFYRKLDVSWGEEKSAYTSFQHQKKAEAILTNSNSAEGDSEVDEDDDGSLGGEVDTSVEALELNTEEVLLNVDSQPSEDESIDRSEEESQVSDSGSDDSSSDEMSDTVDYSDDEIEYTEYADTLYWDKDPTTTTISSSFDFPISYEQPSFQRRQQCWSLTLSADSNTDVGIDSNSTLLKSYQFSFSIRTTPVFFMKKQFHHLVDRRLNISPAYTAEHPEFPLVFGYECSSRPQVPINPIFGRTVPYLASHKELKTRSWQQLHASGAINWELLPRIKFENSSDSPNKNVTDKEPPSPALEQAGSSCGTHKTCDSDLFVSRALHLVENPHELKSWGLDENFLDDLPEDTKLEALIAHLSLNCGDDMTAKDILATVDDALHFEALFLNVLESTDADPSPLKLALGAHFDKSDNVIEVLKSLRFKEEPVHPKLNAKMVFGFSVLLSRRYGARFAGPPGFSTDKILENEFLHYFAGKLLSDCGDVTIHNIVPYTYFLQKSYRGNLDIEPLIEVISCTKILQVPNALTNVITALKETVEFGKVVKVTSDLLKKLVYVFWSTYLSTYKQHMIKEILSQMKEKGFITGDQLEQVVCDQLVSQLGSCILSLRNGNISDPVFSGLEDLLSTLTTHSVVNLRKGTSQIVTQAFELGERVSEVVKTDADTSASMCLLRCYLLLVTLSPDARPAFIAFVGDNQRLVNKVILQDNRVFKACFAILKGNYDLLEFAVKAKIIRNHLPQSREYQIKVPINRERVVQDSYKSIEAATHRDLVSGYFKVTFNGEMGFDGGGLTREWLTLLARSLANTDYGLFRTITGVSNSSIVHPNPRALYGNENSKLYQFVGKVMAKAILAKHQFDCNFSNIIYCALVSKNPGPFSIKDLYYFDNDLAKSLEWMLENDITDVVMETFVTKSSAFGDLQVSELKPGGANIEVNESNKKEYVELMVTHILYKNVKEQIDSICEGFWSILPLRLAKILTATELEKLLCGSRDIDLEEWKSNTVYQNYTADSLTVRYFWQAVKALTAEERCKLLLFTTGSDRVSAHGFTTGNIGTRFTIGKQYSEESTLPSASTCISLLNLPEYRSYDEAIQSIRKVLEYGSLGFGFG